MATNVGQDEDMSKTATKKKKSPAKAKPSVEDKPFSGIIGQPSLLGEVEFYLEGYRATGYFPNTLLIAERGGGKSNLALEIGRALEKPYHEMLAKDLKDSDEFFRHVVIPLLDGRKATIFIDEASLLSDDITHTFLKVLNPEKSNKTTYKWKKNGQTYVFDFTKLTFIFATTAPHKVDPDLKDRLKQFTFEHYKEKDLGTILQQCTPEITYGPGVLDKIASTLRNNPRNATERAKDINGFMKAKKKTVMTQMELNEFNRRLHVLPFGLTKLEAHALRCLAEKPKTSLTTLAAKMHMTAEALRRDIETRLLATSLIDVEPRGRVVTPEGHNVLKEIEKILKNNHK